MDEELDEYLGLLGTLYLQAVMSNEGPHLLRSLGGIFALAANDLSWLRNREDAVLGIIDVSRDQAEVRALARNRWRAYRSSIETSIGSGTPPAVAIERFFRTRTQSAPHTLRQAEHLVEYTSGTISNNGGTPPVPRWQGPIVQTRARIRSELPVMADTFGGVTATTTLVVGETIRTIANGEEWGQFTPDEWHHAIQVGRVGQAVGQIADAGAGVANARAHNSAVSQSGPPTSPAPTHIAAPQGAGRLRRSSGRRRAQQLDLTADDVSRPGTFTSPDSRSARRLRAIEQRLTPDRRRAVGQVVGRRWSNWPEVLDLWNRAIDDTAREAMTRVREFVAAGQMPQARELARSTFNRVRGRFWRAMRESDLRHEITDTGMQLDMESGRRRSAPYYSVVDNDSPGGAREVLTVEHGNTINDHPERALDGSHMSLVFSRENSGMLKNIASRDVFQGQEYVPLQDVQDRLPTE